MLLLDRVSERKEALDSHLHSSNLAVLVALPKGLRDVYRFVCSSEHRSEIRGRGASVLVWTEDLEYEL